MDFLPLIIITTTLLLANLGIISSTVLSMASQSMGKKIDPKKLSWLIINFGFGSFLFASMLLSTICLALIELARQTTILDSLFEYQSLMVILLIVQVLLMIGMMIVRPTQNPWTSQRFKRFLLKRSGKTRSSAEAISLGMASILASFGLIFIPFLTVAAQLINYQLILSIILISLGSIAPALVSLLLVKSENISQIQQKLIKNRHFNQATIIILLLILIFLLVCQTFVSSYGKI